MLPLVKGSLYFQGNLVVTQQMQSILGTPLGSTSDFSSLTSFPSHISLHKLFMGKNPSNNLVLFGEKNASPMQINEAIEV